MKTILLTTYSIVCLSLFLGCKNNSNKEIIEKSSPPNNIQVKEGYQLLQGEFAYYGDVAVLQTQTNIYGVVLDDVAKDLDILTTPYKTENINIIPVKVWGEVFPKKEDETGWPYLVAIKEIVDVYPPKQESIIKINLEQ